MTHSSMPQRKNRANDAVAISMLASRASGEDFSPQLSGGYGETKLSPFADTERMMLDPTYYIESRAHHLAIDCPAVR